MKIQQSGVFSRRAKKLNASQKEALDSAVKNIIDDPSVGAMKVGDLAGIQVYKYKYNTTQYLLAYRFEAGEKALTLLALGTHENFYRDLKR